MVRRALGDSALYAPKYRIISRISQSFFIILIILTILTILIILTIIILIIRIVRPPHQSSHHRIIVSLPWSNYILGRRGRPSERGRRGRRGGYRDARGDARGGATGGDAEGDAAGAHGGCFLETHFSSYDD